MCTAMGFTTKDFYFGRTLDLDCSYGEQVCVVPRNFPFVFRKKDVMKNHHAIIGMATKVGDVPLFYDAANEYGLCMAGLNFPDNAYYKDPEDGADNICQFEFIPWILGQCKSVKEAAELLEKINLVNIPFSERFPVSPLHWIISDKTESVVVESMKDGLHMHQNPVGVMTNNPPFDYQLFNLNNYRGLDIKNGENTFSDNVKLNEYCQGLGSLGLPGDVSSMSRFVRAVFNKENSVCGEGESESVSQFFHVLGSVEMCRGVCVTPSGKCDITVYTSCINADKGLYYYTTYSNRRINCVDMHKENLNASVPMYYPLVLSEEIDYQN